MATTDSKWNVSIEKPALLHVDPRASVGTRYAPSEFTFNADWSPAPLAASNPSSSSFGLGQWSRLYAHNDDAERVSHLDFDEDEDEDEDDEHGEWHGDEYSRPIRRPSDPFADSNAAYLASYGFTNGLGYERPPARSSSSSPSSYSDYNGDNTGDDNFNSNYNNNGGDSNSNSNSKFAANSKFPNDHMSSQNTRRSKIEIETNPRRAELYPELPWPLSHKASNALLNSLALDAPLRDDPCGAWEALCWDEAAPEGDSDDDEDDGGEGEGKRKERDGRGMGEDGRRQQIGRGNIWRKDVGHAIAEEEEEGEDAEDRWRNFLSPPLSSAPSRPRSRSPAPYPTSRDDSTETDVRTISNETSNSTGTSSTITATTTATAAEEEEDSEEWISLTAARAQAARARILPSRAFSSPSAAIPPVQVQVPFPTRTQADISTLVAHIGGGGRRQTRTPVDRVLTTPPPPPLPSSLHISAYQRDPEHENANASGERRGSEDSGGAETETETAPHYGESGRDRLLTLTERDPPPYDLEYGSQMGREEVSARMRGGDADEEMLQGRDVTIGLRASPSTPYPTHASIPHPHARSRSQLTFPTSPTDSLPTLTSRTSPTSASPTETLTTPAGTFFSALFPAPAPAATPDSRCSAAEDSIHYAPGSSKEREGRLGAGAGAGSPFSFSSPVERRMGSSVFAEPARAIPGAGAAARTTPRPLPARPRGARTTAGAWLSASAAGPYASGTRSVVSSVSTPSSGSGWGWSSPSSSDFGPHCAIAFNNGNGNGNGEGEMLPPLTMKVSTEVVVDEDGDMHAERNPFWKGGEEEEEEGRRSTVTLTPLRRGDFFPAPSSLSLPLPLSSSPSPSPSPPVQHHSNSSQTESSKKSMESVKKEQRKDVKSRSKSNSESHVTSTVEAIGLGTRSQKHRSRSSRPLQRLATLSRRIGIVASVGGGR